MADTKFKKCREARGLSQSQLSSLSGISPGTIKAFDQGYKNINNASIKTLVDLALALEVPISDLLSDEDLLKKSKNVKI